MHVGANSSGWFSDVINGRISLTKTYISPLVNLLGLRPREVEFFELLVGYGQAQNLDEKSRFLQRILSFKDIEPLLVTRNKFEFYSNWYFTAIRELLIFYPFTDDYAALAEMLDPPIRPIEAKQAVETLHSIGLVAEDEKGHYRPVDRTITKDPEFQSIHWRNFVISMMRLAIESVDRHEAWQRDISSVTIALSQRGWEIARQEVALLRKRLLVLSEQDSDPEKIYQCNFQLFPLTKSGKVHQ
jgi:uncharacterized protein (TIGR02147 family)